MNFRSFSPDSFLHMNSKTEWMTMNKFGQEEEYLARLAKKVADCHKCSISNLTTRVPGEGLPSAAVMFVGIAPNEEGGQLGKPFVGATGKLLDQWLDYIALPRKAVYLTNIVKCVMPRYRNGVRQRPLVPRYAEVEACRPFLTLEIELIQPKLIVMLGTPPVRWFFPGETSISSFREGGVCRIEAEWIFFALSHPSYVMQWYISEEDLRAELDQLLLVLRRLSVHR